MSFMKGKSPRVTDEMVDRGARAIFDAFPANVKARHAATWEEAHPDIRERLRIEARACLIAGLADDDE